MISLKLNGSVKFTLGWDHTLARSIDGGIFLSNPTANGKSKTTAYTWRWSDIQMYLVLLCSSDHVLWWYIVGQEVVGSSMFFCSAATAKIFVFLFEFALRFGVWVKLHTIPSILCLLEQGVAKRCWHVWYYVWPEGGEPAKPNALIDMITSEIYDKWDDLQHLLIEDAVAGNEKQGACICYYMCIV